MAFKIVSGGLKLGGTATLEPPEEPKFKVVTGGLKIAPVTTPTISTYQPSEYESFLGKRMKQDIEANKAKGITFAPPVETPERPIMDRLLALSATGARAGLPGMVARGLGKPPLAGRDVEEAIRKYPGFATAGTILGGAPTYAAASMTGLPLPLTFGALGVGQEALRQKEEEAKRSLVLDKALTPVQKTGRLGVAGVGGAITGQIFKESDLGKTILSRILQASVGAGATGITEEIAKEAISKREPNLPNILTNAVVNMATIAVAKGITEIPALRNEVWRVAKDVAQTKNLPPPTNYQEAITFLKSYGINPEELSPVLKQALAPKYQEYQQSIEQGIQSRKSLSYVEGMAKAKGIIEEFGGVWGGGKQDKLKIEIKRLMSEGKIIPLSNVEINKLCGQIRTLWSSTMASAGRGKNIPFVLTPAELLGATEGKIEVPKFAGKAVTPKAPEVSIPQQFADPYAPKLLDYLNQYIPGDVVARLPSAERLRLANAPINELRDFALTAKPGMKFAGQPAVVPKVMAPPILGAQKKPEAPQVPTINLQSVWDMKYGPKQQEYVKRLANLESLKSRAQTGDEIDILQRKVDTASGSLQELENAYLKDIQRVNPMLLDKARQFLETKKAEEMAAKELANLDTMQAEIDKFIEERGKIPHKKIEEMQTLARQYQAKYAPKEEVTPPIVEELPVVEEVPKFVGKPKITPTKLGKTGAIVKGMAPIPKETPELTYSIGDNIQLKDGSTAMIQGYAPPKYGEGYMIVTGQGRDKFITDEDIVGLSEEEPEKLELLKKLETQGKSGTYFNSLSVEELKKEIEEIPPESPFAKEKFVGKAKVPKFTVSEKKRLDSAIEGIKQDVTEDPERDISAIIAGRGFTFYDDLSRLYNYAVSKGDKEFVKKLDEAGFMERMAGQAVKELEVEVKPEVTAPLKFTGKLAKKVKLIPKEFEGLSDQATRMDLPRFLNRIRTEPELYENFEKETGFSIRDFWTNAQKIKPEIKVGIAPEIPKKIPITPIEKLQARAAEIQAKAPAPRFTGKIKGISRPRVGVGKPKSDLDVVALNVPRKPGLPILSNIHIKGNIIYATDLDSVIIYKADKPIANISIPAEHLKGVSLGEIKPIPGKPNMLQVGNLQAIGMDISEAPEIPKVENVQLSTELNTAQISDAISRALPFASKDETRYVLNGVYLQFSPGKLEVTTTDGRRLFNEIIPIKVAQSIKVNIPVEPVKKLLKLLNATNPPTIKFEVFGKKGQEQINIIAGKYQFIARTIEGEFPAYKQIIPTKQQTYFSVNTQDLYNLVKGIPKNLITPDYLAVELSIQEDKLLLYKAIPDVGKYTQSISIKKFTTQPAETKSPQQIVLPMKIYGGEKRDVEITKGKTFGINPEFLIDAMTSSPTGQVIIGYDNPEKPITVTYRGPQQPMAGGRVRLPPSFKPTEPADTLLGKLQRMMASEMKVRAYERMKEKAGGHLSDSDNMDYLQTQSELEDYIGEIYDDILPIYEEWLKIHEGPEGWAEAITDKSGEQGIYSHPSEVFDKEVGKMTMGQAWSIDVSDEIVEKYNKEIATELPEDPKEILEEIESYVAEDKLRELKKQFKKGEIDENDLRNELQDAKIEYGEEFYHLVDNGSELMEMLDVAGWQSQLGDLIWDVLTTKGYQQWKENFPSMDEVEESIRKAYQELENATTSNEKIAAISIALNTEHVFGTMAEKMDLSKDDLDMLSAMGKEVKNLEELWEGRQGKILKRGAIYRISEDTQITSTSGNKVTLPKGEEYTVYELENNKYRLQDGKQVTVYEGELDKIKGEILGEGEITAGGLIHLSDDEKRINRIKSMLRKETRQELLNEMNLRLQKFSMHPAHFRNFMFKYFQVARPDGLSNKDLRRVVVLLEQGKGTPLAPQEKPISVSEGWQDINKVEIYSLDPARIIEKVTGKDLWADNILADNTFLAFASANDAMVDRLVNELGDLESNKEGIVKYSKADQELMRKFEAKEKLTEKEQKVIDYLHSKLDGLFYEANIVRQSTETKSILYRQHYLPHIIEQNLIDEFFKGNYERTHLVTSAQLDAIRKGDYTKGYMPFNKFAQRRRGNLTKLGAIGNYEIYLKTILNEIYYAPAIKHGREFIQDYLIDQPNAYKALDRLLNDLKGKPSIVDQNLLGAIASSAPIKWIRHRIAANALIGNLNFWAINASNFTVSFDELGPYMAKGMQKFLGTKEWREFAFRNSKMLKGRTIDPDIDPSTFRKLEEVVGYITNLLEYNNVGSTFVGAYFKGIEKLGYTKEKAIIYADSIARRTQVGYKKYELPAWMRSNTGMLLSQFQSWAFNAMNHLIYDIGLGNIPRNILGKLTGQAKKPIRWGAFFTLLATSMLVNMLYKKMGIRQPYQLGAAIPNVAGVSMSRYGDIGPVRIAKDIGMVFTGKKPETRYKAGIRAATTVLPPFGGTQLGRFFTGRILPETKEEKEAGKFTGRSRFPSKFQTKFKSKF